MQNFYRTCLNHFITVFLSFLQDHHFDGLICSPIELICSCCRLCHLLQDNGTGSRTDANWPVRYSPVAITWFLVNLSKTWKHGPSKINVVILGSMLLLIHVVCQSTSMHPRFICWFHRRSYRHIPLFETVAVAGTIAAEVLTLRVVARCLL